MLTTVAFSPAGPSKQKRQVVTHLALEKVVTKIKNKWCANLLSLRSIICRSATATACATASTLTTIPQSMSRWSPRTPTLTRRKSTHSWMWLASFRSTASSRLTKRRNLPIQQARPNGYRSFRNVHHRLSCSEEPVWYRLKNRQMRKVVSEQRARVLWHLIRWWCRKRPASTPTSSSL